MDLEDSGCCILPSHLPIHSPIHWPPHLVIPPYLHLPFHRLMAGKQRLHRPVVSVQKMALSRGSTGAVNAFISKTKALYSSSSPLFPQGLSVYLSGESRLLVLPGGQTPRPNNTPCLPVCTISIYRPGYRCGVVRCLPGLRCDVIGVSAVPS